MFIPDCSVLELKINAFFVSKLNLIESGSIISFPSLKTGD